MKKIVATLLCGVALFAAGPLRRAPGFCLIDTSGQWQDLADYRGKIVLVEFMQTTCPHCATFSTVLNGLKLKYGDRLAILSIANPPDNPQTMMQFVTGHKLTYPLLLDQGQVAASYVRVAIARSADGVSDRRQRHDSELLGEWRAHEGHFRRQRALARDR